VSVRALHERFFPEIRFGGFSDIDGDVAFYLRVNELLRPDATVLDLGCGPGTFARDVRVRAGLRVLRGKCARVIGADVDPAAASNPNVDEFRQLGDGAWPVEDRSIDLCVCDWVLEHVADPARFFGECARVIRPGGYLCLRTSNARGYVGLAARLIPERWHRRVLSRVQREREEFYPTVFRCNTVPAIRRALGRAGFDHCVYGYEAEPSYLTFSTLAYRIGLAHMRFAPRNLRLAIFAFGRREED
jgi:SAM-dependent methyltransferase